MNPKYKYEHQLLPYKIIKSATEGDVDAVYAVLKHYDGYIETLSKEKCMMNLGRNIIVLMKLLNEDCRLNY